MKILIVDDDPISRKLLRMLVESHGHGVIEASDGQEGLEKAGEHRPDAIISDAVMPGMDGFQFLRAVRQDETLRAIPFVFYTGIYTEDKEYAIALSLGADALIVKPKAPADFWKEFTSALEAHTSKKKQAAHTPLIGRDEAYLNEYCRMVAAKLEEKVRDMETIIADHERTKTILLESEELYRLLFESNPHPMWVYDLETLAFLTVNDAAVNKYGYSRDEFLTMTIKDIRPLEDVPALIDKVSRVPEGFDEAGIWRHLKKDGTIIDVEITSHSIIFAGRRAELILVNDVTERKKLVDELKAAVVRAEDEKARADSIIAAIGDGITIQDRDFKIVYQNKAFKEMIGDHLGELCYMAYEKREQRCEGCPVAQVFEDGKVHTVVRSAPTDKGIIYVENTASPLLDSMGNIIAGIEVVHNITGRKKMEEALERQKQFTENLIQNTAVATFVLDAQHSVLIWNRACEELTGFPSFEMLGTTAQWRPFCDHERPVLADVVLSGDPEKLLSLHPTYSKSLFKSNGLHAEEWCKNLNGRDRYIMFDAAPIYSPEGKVIAAIETLQDITERKLAEDLLKEEKNKAQKYLDIAGVMIVALDSGGRVTLINKKGLEILGHEEHEVINKYWFDLCIPSHLLEEVKDNFNKMMSGDIKPVEYYENPIITKGGTERILAFHNAVIRDVSGEISGTLSSGEDITERKKSEAALELYSHELTSLNMASDTLMLITDLGDIYEEICNIIYTVFDLKMVWLGVIGEGSFEVKPVAHAGFEDGYLSAIRVTWDDSPAGMGPVGMSIKSKTVIKENINDLLFAPWKSEAQKRGYEIVLSVPIMYARDKCLGALTFYSDNPDYFTSDRIKLYQIFANQAAIAIENARLVSGLELEVKRRTKALEDTNIELHKLNKELYLRRQEADAASKSKTDFLANMSHELRTPLNAIMGFSDIMQQGMAGPVTDKQKEFLGDISDSSNHLLTLITDILDLSKVEAGKLDLEPGTVSLKEIIEGSLSMFKEKALKHAITATSEIDDTITSITADQRKLKQIIVNLLSNAFKFTPDGGSVHVAARRVVRDLGLGVEKAGVRGLGLGVSEKGPIPSPQQPTPDRDFIEISVTDTGIGISKENQQRLFQSFQQIETSLTRKYAGTGLGLSLCRRLVELHGGRIWVESEPGKGSKFVFIIPMKQ